MRLATLVTGLIVGALLLFQSFTLVVFSAEGTTNAGAASAGLIMAFLWLVASVLAVAFPHVSMALFGVSALIGMLSPTGAFEELRFHGGTAMVLAAMAYLGWREKKKHDKEVATERARQRRRDNVLAHVLRSRAMTASDPMDPPYVPAPATTFTDAYKPEDELEPTRMRKTR